MENETALGQCHCYPVVLKLPVATALATLKFRHRAATNSSALSFRKETFVNSKFHKICSTVRQPFGLTFRSRSSNKVVKYVSYCLQHRSQACFSIAMPKKTKREKPVFFSKVLFLKNHWNHYFTFFFLSVALTIFSS